ncbi:tetratricopeptide repeat protein [Niabella sp. 22666]|uniref:tetratricopeptide repeat protein n=1 Tax=Niabella sp. 22666 TaxID=3453954 RepID=UPI003F84C5D7
MEKKFFSWEDFSNGFGKEMVLAEDVFNSMKESGLKNGTLTKMDFTFISDQKEKLEKLSTFLAEHYPYSMERIQKPGNTWELNGQTNEIPITQNNLLYWALDMRKRAYEFDSFFDAYGGISNTTVPRFLALDSSKAADYFDKALQYYDEGNLSGAIFYWSLVIDIDSTDVNAYYSRAIVKNELHTWKAALKDYDKAIELAPNFVDALINRGSLKDENEDYQGAIADYETVLEFANIEIKDKQSTYFNLGNTYLNLGDKDKACEHWKIALSLGDDKAPDQLNKYCIE